MMLWIVTLFISGFGVAVNLSRLMHNTPDYKVASISIIVFAILGLYCGYAIFHNKTAGTSQSNVDKIVDMFIRGWDRVSLKLSSGRWMFTVVAAIAFFMFCDVVCKIIVKAADKLPDTTVVALFMFLAGIIQNIVKDYFNMDRSDPENGITNGNGNGNGNGHDKPTGPQGIQGPQGVK